jgi:hypothetical protein
MKEGDYDGRRSMKTELTAINDAHTATKLLHIIVFYVVISSILHFHGIWTPADCGDGMQPRSMRRQKVGVLMAPTTDSTMQQEMSAKGTLRKAHKRKIE